MGPINCAPNPCAVYFPTKENEYSKINVLKFLNTLLFLFSNKALVISECLSEKQTGKTVIRLLL